MIKKEFQVIVRLKHISIIFNYKTFKIMIYLLDTGTIKWKDTAKTSDTDSKGKLSLTSVLCEWLSTLLILVYTVTMVPEFRLFRISKPQVTIVMDR